MRISDWSSDVCSSDLLPDGHNYTFTTYADDPAVWEREAIGADGRGLKQNILDFLKRMREEDLNCPLNFVDPQTDRSNPDAQAKSANLRVVNKTDEGIFVTGVKSVGTGIAYGDYLHRSEEHTSELQSLMRISYAVSCFKK